MTRVGGDVRTVSADEADVRLDRWFGRHFPQLGHGRLQRLLRTGQVRVEGKRARANLRLQPGQAVRVPPVELADAPAPAARPSLSAKDRAFVRGLVLYEDDDLIALNKPAGLAVQGGTGTTRHLDGLLDALSNDGERPRLVHRLDRDTSGVLVVARTARVAAELTGAFRRHAARKLYWALVAGRPRPSDGLVDAPLMKLPGARGEAVSASEVGRAARTVYRMLDAASKVAAWLALQPLTGRTHQLRVHCAEVLKTPILGDVKYGGPKALLAGAPKGLMLHARLLRLPRPDGRLLEVVAPPPPHLADALAWLGFRADHGADRIDT
jgi:23S rRNA pseudouridine955/2504/2580 synthase